MTALQLAIELKTEAVGARNTVANLASLRTRNVIAVDELSLASEAALLAVHTALEKFVRELFLECLAGLSGIDQVRSRIRVANTEEARLILLDDRRYIEWLPLERTLQRAQSSLGYGQPFVKLWGRESVVRHVNNMHITRNRIAHSSDEALSKYHKHISKGDAAYDRPAYWLLRSNGRTTNFDLIADSVAKIADALSENSRTPTDLGSAEADAGTYAPPGSYRCANCSRLIHLPQWEKLNSCPRCSSTHQCATCGRQSRSRTRWTLEKLRAG